MSSQAASQSTCPRVKICGLTREADVRCVNRLLPDYAGFVFAPSRRRLDADTAAGLIAALSPEILSVGVFVDAPVDTVVDIVQRCGLRVVQLHGGESVPYLRALRGRLPGEVAMWKAFRMKDAGTVRQVEALMAEQAADRVLLDAWHPEQAGGTGEVFDWRLLAALRVPYLLAGGLTPGNVEQAVRQVGPWGLDVSSGVETDGRKDERKMAAFVRAARRVAPVGA